MSRLREYEQPKKLNLIFIYFLCLHFLIVARLIFTSFFSHPHCLSVYGSMKPTPLKKIYLNFQKCLNHTRTSYKIVNITKCISFDFYDYDNIVNMFKRNTRNLTNQVVLYEI